MLEKEYDIKLKAFKKSLLLKRDTERKSIVRFNEVISNYFLDNSLHGIPRNTIEKIQKTFETYQNIFTDPISNTDLIFKIYEILHVMNQIYYSEGKIEKLLKSAEFF